MRHINCSSRPCGECACNASLSLVAPEFAWAIWGQTLTIERHQPSLRLSVLPEDLLRNDHLQGASQLVPVQRDHQLPVERLRLRRNTYRL